MQFGDYYGSLAQEYYDNVPTAEEATLVPVAAGASVQGIDATLARAGRLVGKATDELGVGVAVQVQACRAGEYQDDECRWTSATQLGNWAMTLPSGQYRVRFSASGFTPEWYADAANEADGQLITVTPASEQRLNAELAATVVAEGGTLTLTVTGDPGTGVAPLAGAGVELTPFGTGDVEYRARTGADGVARFTSVAPGAYYAWVENSPDWVGRFVGGDGSLAQAAAIQVVTGQPTDDSVTLARAASIAGAVMSDSQPVDYVSVRAYTLAGDSVGSGYTDYHGEYRIPGLVGGQYRLFVDASRAPGNLASRWVGGGTDPRSAQVFTIVDGEQLPDIDVDLVGSARVAGTVMAAPDGELLRGILVELYAVDQDGGQIIDYDYTDKEGGFSFGHLSAGAFKVRAGGVPMSCDPGIVGCTAPMPTALAPAWVPTWFSAADTFAGATQVVLAAGQRRLDIDVALPAATAGTQVTIVGPSVVTSGTNVALSGSTTGRPADAVVVVQSKSGDSWNDLATATLAGAGWAASLVAPAPGSVIYRAVMRQGAAELAVSGREDGHGRGSPHRPWPPGNSHPQRAR